MTGIRYKIIFTAALTAMTLLAAYLTFVLAGGMGRSVCSGDEVAYTYATPILTGAAAFTGIVILVVSWWPGNDRTHWLAPATLISMVLLCCGIVFLLPFIGKSC